MGTLFSQSKRAQITVEVDQTLALQITQLKRIYKDRGERFSVTKLIETSVMEAMAKEEDNETEGTMFM
ncbi:MAG: hypothetical protein HOM11_17125 [Methylococcales bacterium]|jgi:hypothetical protein|nr:hypothetical protein [Methylococcales bacterium]MBT7443609.1 hypothetical protein [Methylococcales bacterium]